MVVCIIMNGEIKESFVEYFKNDIVKRKGKSYIDIELLKNFLGYKNDPTNLLNGMDAILTNGIHIIKVSNAVLMITTRYNKRNPDVIDYHRLLNYVSDDYTIEAITLNKITNYLKSVNVRYENQYNMIDIKKRIDLYIPEYKICIECDERNHIDRNPQDEEIRESELISMDYRVLHYDPHNFNEYVVINRLKKLIMFAKTELNINNEETIKKLLNEFNENSLEMKYYDLFGESIIEGGYNVNFENVWKMCGYSRKDVAKRLLENRFIKDIEYRMCAFPQIRGQGEDYNLTPHQSGARWGGHNKEIIMLNSDSFKKFCLLCDTREGEEIRLWYLKMEKQYQQLLVSLLHNIKDTKDKLVKINTKKILETAKEVQLKKEEYRSGRKNAHIIDVEIEKEECKANKGALYEKKEISELMELMNKMYIDMCNMDIRNIFNENSLEILYEEMVGELSMEDEFVVDFDNVWRMCEYSTKEKGLYILEKYFKENEDYVFASQNNEAKTGRGGHNIKKYWLNRKTLKGYCMLCNMDKGKEIRTWYIKMEEQHQRLLASIKEIKEKLANINAEKIFETAEEVKFKKKLYKNEKGKGRIIDVEHVKEEKIGNKVFIDDVNNKEIEEEEKMSELMEILNIINQQMNKQFIQNPMDFNINTNDMTNQFIEDVMTILTPRLQDFQKGLVGWVKINRTKAFIKKIITHYAEKEGYNVSTSKIMIEKKAYTNYGIINSN